MCQKGNQKITFATRVCLCVMWLIRMAVADNKPSIYYSTKFISFVSSRVNWADSGAAYLCTHITHHYRICHHQRYQNCFFFSANIFDVEFILALTVFHHSIHTRRLFDMLISSIQLEIMIDIKYRRFAFNTCMAMAERCASTNACLSMYDTLIRDA